MKWSKARWRPLNFSNKMPNRTPMKAVILHTNAGGKDVFDWFNRPGNDIAAHFQIYVDGSCDQFIDTSKQAFAAFQSNVWAIQVETEDDGHPEKPWTIAQLDTIIALCKWARTGNVILKETPSNGVGWHCQYYSWNKDAHTCPGKVRIAQIKNVIIPALLPIDWSPLKVNAVKIADRLGIDHTGVNVTSPSKGKPFETLLVKLAKAKD